MIILGTFIMLELEDLPVEYVWACEALHGYVANLVK